MFCKHYTVEPNHVDFQDVVDGLYYPFYLEWALLNKSNFC